MPIRNIILLVVAVLFAAGTAMFVRSRMETPAVIEEVTGPKILVAKKDIGAGSFVNSAQDLEWVSWPQAGIQQQYIVEGTEDLNSFQGAVARRAVKVGEPLTVNALVKPGAGGFLSAVLEPGMRAVSLAVSPTSGTAGFIFPGDRVDLMVTHRVKTQPTMETAVQENIISEIFIENVRVVAVDQMLDNPDNKAILAKTVTVEVTPEQAQKISVAEDLGRISFALRSLAADDQVLREAAEAAPAGEGEAAAEATKDFISALEPPAPSHVFTSSGDISRVLDQGSEAKPRILVIRGDKSEHREFYQEQP